MDVSYQTRRQQLFTQYLNLTGNCSYREDCTLKNWGDWSGEIPEVGCTVQVRKRDYNNSLIYVQRDSCDGLNSCPKIRDEVRTTCKYQFMKEQMVQIFIENFNFVSVSTFALKQTRTQSLLGGAQRIVGKTEGRKLLSPSSSFP